MTLADLFATSQFSIRQEEKERILVDHLNGLTQWHDERCTEYRRLLSHGRPHGQRYARTIDEVPYLPVSLFKSHRLRSVADKEVRNVLTSSGTQGQGVSQIAIDAETANLQNRALASIVKSAIGGKRLPMLLADSSAVIRDPAMMSARGAGVLGFMRFGRDHAFVLDERMEPNLAALQNFIRAHGRSPFVVFGFTFMVWQFLYEIVARGGYDFSQGILLHSGGWKKLQAISVDNATFRRRFAEACGLRRIYNFYGMVEQLGSIFLEGDDGLLYPPNFADVVVRDPVTWRAAATGTQGIVQVLSLLPRSYPGHSLLTEDLGVIEVIDSGVGGRYGKGVRILGRVPRSELRGCSDTFAADSQRSAA